jgi:SAM-dependent methyltransferase
MTGKEPSSQARPSRYAETLRSANRLFTDGRPQSISPEAGGEPTTGLLRKTHEIAAPRALHQLKLEAPVMTGPFGSTDLESPRSAIPGAKIVLNVGCGYPGQGLHSTFQGGEWRELRLDINPAVNPDILCSMTDMRPVDTSSIDAIWSSHNLEHLHRHEVPAALGEFLRVLRPGGLLLLTLPDLQKVAELVAADGLESEAYLSRSGPISPLDMIYGHTASIAHGNFHMAHKTGFTARTLQQLLTAAGFGGLTLSREGFALWARAFKPVP